MHVHLPKKISQISQMIWKYGKSSEMILLSYAIPKAMTVSIFTQMVLDIFWT